MAWPQAASLATLPIIMTTVETVTIAFASGTALATTLLVVATFLNVRELKKLREAEFRPHIVVEVVVKRSAFRVGIRNAGPVGAHDISVVFEPPLIGQFPRDERGTDLGRLPMFQQNSYMAPGQQLETFFWVCNVLLGKQSLPRTYRATAKYRDERGRQYESTSTLDFGAYWMTEDEANASEELVREVKNLVGAVKSIQQGLRR